MRLMIIGQLEGYISQAGKIALQKGAKVIHCEDTQQAIGALGHRGERLFALDTEPEDLRVAEHDRLVVPAGRVRVRDRGVGRRQVVVGQRPGRTSGAAHRRGPRRRPPGAPHHHHPLAAPLPGRCLHHRHPGTARAAARRRRGADRHGVRGRDRAGRPLPLPRLPAWGRARLRRRRNGSAR